MVTTAPDADPVALAQLYRQRWPVQENILKDWLLPLGLEIVCTQMTCIKRSGLVRHPLDGMLRPDVLWGTLLAK
jgi:hypothetical protein